MLLTQVEIYQKLVYNFIIISCMYLLCIFFLLNLWPQHMEALERMEERIQDLEQLIKKAILQKQGVESEKQRTDTCCNN